jgi:hypothetical protein
VSKAVSSGNIQALNYFIAQKYVDALSQIAKSNNPRLVILAMEMSAIASTVGGIAELAKSSGGKLP